MYSHDDILYNVQQRNNILDHTHFNQLKDIIQNSTIKCQDIFSKFSQYNIDLSSNTYVTDTIFNIIKNKFDYNGNLDYVFCKIQSISDDEPFDIISKDTNYTVFSLDINNTSILEIDNNSIINMTAQDQGAACSQIYQTVLTLPNFANNEDILPSINSLNFPSSYNSISSLNPNKMLDPNKMEDEPKKNFLRDFYLNKQNLLDSMGYLYFLSYDHNTSVGVAYEHINNNCIKFPAHYIHKTSPYFKFSDSRRISIIFVCKNI
jgi:hypothetical protein